VRGYVDNVVYNLDMKILVPPFDDLNAVTRLIELRKEGRNVQDIALYFDVTSYVLVKVMFYYDIPTGRLNNGKRKDFKFLKERWKQQPTKIKYKSKHEPVYKPVELPPSKDKYAYLTEEKMCVGKEYKQLLKEKGIKFVKSL